MSSRQRKRPVVFGEVLFDRFPDGTAVLGGAPFNVAWNLQAFGQAPLFISRVGDDELGARIRGQMHSWGMDTRCLQIDDEHPTGTVDVAFEGREPHYDIVADRAYDFVEPVDDGALAEAAVLYHGSLALRHDRSRQTFDRLVTQSSAPRFLDVNLREPWWQLGQVLELIRGASWVKLNRDELERLQPARSGDEETGGGPADRGSGLGGTGFRRDHGLRAVILTLGRAGAEWIDAERTVRIQPAGAGSVVDTVGAGDAFASVALTGLLQGWPVESTLKRAQAFASAVVGVRGATQTDAEFYACFARAWGLAAR